MRSHRLYAHDKKGFMPRMSWAPQNLYSLLVRSSNPAFVSETRFNRTSMTMYQQRWRAKRLIRAFHGNWIRERRFKRWFLPVSIPRVDTGTRGASSSTESLAAQSSTEEIGRDLAKETAARNRIDERLPIASLFVRDVERRLDTVVFRSCFARSAYEARQMVVHGKVKVNGATINNAGRLLEPGDLISVLPTAVPMLSEAMEKAAAEQRAAELATKSEAIQKMVREKEQAEEAERTKNAEDKASEAKENAGEGSVTAAGAEQSSDSDMPEQPASVGSQDKGKGRADATEAKNAEVKKEQLPPGVRPFNLPPFAAPFLFLPGHLEVSFSTCSAIYMRHPTVLRARSQSRQEQGDSRPPVVVSGQTPFVKYHTDIASPYPATGEIFSMAWEHYTRSAPRTRSYLRRQQMEAKVGRQGFASARAKDEWKKLRAERRGRTKSNSSSPGSAKNAHPRLVERRKRRRFQKQRSQKKRRQFVVGGRGASFRRARVPPPAAGQTSHRVAAVRA